MKIKLLNNFLVLLAFFIGSGYLVALLMAFLRYSSVAVVRIQELMFTIQSR